MSDATHFLRNILETAQIGDQRTGAFIAFVDADAGTHASIYRPEEDDTAAFLARKATLFALDADDVVVAVPIGRESLIIGKLVTAATSDIDVAALTADSLVTGAITGTTTNVGALTAISMNSPVFAATAFSNATVTSTTNTGTFQEACTVSITLPPGTWSLVAVGAASLAHGSTGSVNMVIEIDGVQDTARTVSMLDTGPMMIVDTHTATGVSGNRSVAVRTMYKASTAGTVTCKNPYVFVIAWRTS